MLDRGRRACEHCDEAREDAEVGGPVCIRKVFIREAGRYRRCRGHDNREHCSHRARNWNGWLV